MGCCLDVAGDVDYDGCAYAVAVDSDAYVDAANQ